MGKKRKLSDIMATTSRRCCCPCHEMADGGPSRQRRRRGRARLSDVGSHSPPEEEGGERTHGSAVRAPPIATDYTSFMPTPPVDPRVGYPFLHPSQVPGRLSLDAGLQASTAREPLVDPTSWRTYGHLTPFDAGLYVSGPTPNPFGRPTAQPTQGRRLAPCDEWVRPGPGKILIEPEGESFKPHKGIPKRIGEIVKGKFPGAWATWGEIPGEQRDLWFNEFKRYYYWEFYHSKAVRRNFEIKGAKQLRNFYAYARKSGKAPHFVSPENWANLQKYWESKDFKMLSSQNKKNRAGDAELGAALHTSGATPIAERRRQLTASLEREPTLAELYMETHKSKKKEKAGSWVSKKAELKMEEHEKRWKEYRDIHTTISSPSVSANRSRSPVRHEEDFWLDANVNQKGGVYGVGDYGAWMKFRANWSSSSRRSTSVKNYDACEMAMRLNEAALKAAEEARQKESERLKALESELALEKAARKREQAARKRDKSKLSKLWRFFKTQQAGSSAAPPDSTLSGDDDDNDDEDDLSDS